VTDKRLKRRGGQFVGGRAKGEEAHEIREWRRKFPRITGIPLGYTQKRGGRGEGKTVGRTPLKRSPSLGAAQKTLPKSPEGQPRMFLRREWTKGGRASREERGGGRRPRHYGDLVGFVASLTSPEKVPFFSQAEIRARTVERPTLSEPLRARPVRSNPFKCASDRGRRRKRRTNTSLPDSHPEKRKRRTKEKRTLGRKPKKT